MNLISLDGVAKALGEAPLFEGASLGIDSGERIGLVGRNGRGKTTFLRLLAGDLEPDVGTIARKRGLSTSALRQRPSFAAGETLGGFLYGGDSSIIRAAAERRSSPLAASVASTGGIAGFAMTESTAEDEALERAYASICTELGLPAMSSPMETLSGGMVKKAAIARALAPGAELLLLDEPTNHLDVETIEWLERRLSQATFAFVLVTHDRWFLDAVCNTMMDIDRRELHKYPGAYADYLERRIEREAALEKAESRRLTILKRELAWLNRGARARATKSERRKDAIRGMQAAGLEQETGIEGFSTLRRRLGKKVLELEGVGKSYDGREIIRPFSRSFRGGERVGIVGPNGSGKTTFLDLVSCRISPDRGRVDKGENTHFVYFDQTAASLDQGTTVLGLVRERAERIPMSDGSVLSPEQLLERFLFPRAMLDLPLSRLSGGELRRLQLVRLLAESPNFLLLDEPTNDLDIDTIELLEDFIADFSGCVLAVSHDRAFLDGMADSILAFDGSGGIKEYVGRYADYRSIAGDGAAAAARPVAARGNRDRRVRDDSGSVKPLSYAERQELDTLLDEVSLLEDEKMRLEALFASSSPEPIELARANRRYPELSVLLEAKIARWENLASRDRRDS